MTKSPFPLILATLLLLGCAGNTTKNGSENNAGDSTVLAADSVLKDTVFYAPQTTSEAAASRIREFLAEFLKKDLATMPPEERKFSFYEVDLNDDGKNEYMVRLQGTWFCGSGGCTFILLDDNFKKHTYFTVTNPPVFVSSATTNGWHDLILWGDFDQNGGVKNFIHLKYSKKTGKYPSNPSLVEKTTLAPSSHDLVMWHDDFSRAKVFEY